MGNIEIVLFAVAFAILGMRLYKKYIKKDEGKSGVITTKRNNSSFPTKSQDDDYEPYSKK